MIAWCLVVVAICLIGIVVTLCRWSIEERAWREADEDADLWGGSD